MDLKEHISKALNENTTVVTYVNDHIIRFNGMERLGKEWVNYAESNDLDEMYDKMIVEIDYSTNKFKAEIKDLPHIIFTFKSSKDFNSLYNAGRELKASDLKCESIIGRGTKYPTQAHIDHIEEITNILVWLFNSQPEPLF